MTATTRETCRDTLAARINTAMVGAGKPLVACYAYQLKDLAGQAPVVLIVSGGSQRKQKAIGSTEYRSKFRLTAMIFVPAAAGVWTEQNAEDSLDTIESGLADVIAANRGKANDPTLPWSKIEHDDRMTDPMPISLGSGANYLFEAIDFIASVDD